MKRLFVLTVLSASFAAPMAVPASAQTAYRCDQGGQTVYSDKPCPPGHAAKAVAPTQDSPAQRAAAREAADQVRKDNAELNKRLSEREKLEAQERAAARKAAGKAPVDGALPGKGGKAAGKAKSGAGKAKAGGKKGKTKGKAKPADNAVSRPAG